jgi:N-acetylglucosamine-6-sulfatase
MKSAGTFLLIAQITLLAGLTTAATARKKNIIVFLTDDQDVSTLEQRRYLPKIHEHLVDEGTQFTNFFAPVSVCCPSRVSLLRTRQFGSVPRVSC